MAPGLRLLTPGQFRSDSGAAVDAPSRVDDASSVAVARLDRPPLARAVLEPAPPLRPVGAVPGMAGAILGLDHAEALVREEAERVRVVGELDHWAMVTSGWIRCHHPTPATVGPGWRRLGWPSDVKGAQEAVSGERSEQRLRNKVQVPGGPLNRHGDKPAGGLHY